MNRRTLGAGVLGAILLIACDSGKSGNPTPTPSRPKRSVRPAPTVTPGPSSGGMRTARQPAPTSKGK